MHVVGMPGHVHVDLTGLWQREIDLRGGYAYGTETPTSDERRTFDLAFGCAAADLGRLVSATYPLARYERRHRPRRQRRSPWRGQVAFDLRNEKERDDLWNQARPPCRASCSTSTGRRRRSCSTTARGSASRQLPAGRIRVIYPAEPLAGRSTTPTRRSATRC